MGFKERREAEAIEVVQRLAVIAALTPEVRAAYVAGDDAAAEAAMREAIGRAARELSSYDAALVREWAAERRAEAGA